VDLGFVLEDLWRNHLQANVMVDRVNLMRVNHLVEMRMSEWV
tara:strand:- start:413 stop:538 length:126 start_codon:yes stop_codon:yes gene_type:complete